MSPNDTNTRKQAKRHVPALVGIAAAVAIAVIAALVAFIVPRMPAEEQATPVPAPNGSGIEAAEEAEGE